MLRPTRPMTRRFFIPSFLIAPLFCLGCGADGVVVDTKAGEKRGRMMEDLKRKADLSRQSAKPKAGSH
jgi:hypothetical protein